MHIIKPGFYADFMRYRRTAVIFSSFLILASFASLYWPGPNYGIDFAGGIEVQVPFKGDVTAAELRQTLTGMGYRAPDVIQVTGQKAEYIIRIRHLTALDAKDIQRMRSALNQAVPGAQVKAMDVSPGGEKVSLRFSKDAPPEAIIAALQSANTKPSAVTPFGPPNEHRYEVQLQGVADQLIKRLSDQLGDRGPETSSRTRVEWVGPKVGEQLRDAAVKSFLYAIVFIMLYVALRFDLRFAPGGIIALIHDAIVTMGVFILLRREINLTFIAAILTITGYSINDTIVIYDRVRENLGRKRDANLRELINVSTSETLSRTILTAGVTAMSLLAFLIWGTPAIKDLALALLIGIVVGSYSTIYIAAPVTEWVDRRFFKRAAA